MGKKEETIFQQNKLTSWYGQNEKTIKIRNSDATFVKLCRFMNENEC